MVARVFGVSCLLWGSLMGVASADWDRNKTCGSQQLTVSTTSVGLTTPTTCTTSPFAIVKVFCSVATADIRMRLDGVAPDTNTGHVVTSASYLYIENPAEITNARFIRDGTDDAILDCSFRWATQ